MLKVLCYNNINENITSIGQFGWQEYAIVDKEGWANGIQSAKASPRKLPEGMTLTLPLNLCGLVGFTAYFGLLRIGDPKPGETIVISGAAGATGKIVHNSRVVD